MQRDEADRLLSGIGAAHDRIAGAMFGIDCHPGLGFLRSGAHTGATARRWESLRPQIDMLWAAFGVLGDALERARALRATHRPSDAEWAPLVTLLTGAAVRLDETGMPTLSVPGGTMRLGALAAQVEVACATVSTSLSEVDAAWTATARAVTPITEAETAFGALARDLDDTTELGTLTRRAALLRDDVLADPLATAPAGVLTGTTRTAIEALAADLQAATTRLRAQATLRDAYPQRIADLRAAVDVLDEAERQAATAFARATEKIADPGLPPAPDAGTVLRQRVTALVRGRISAVGPGTADRDATADSLIAGAGPGAWRRLADDVAIIQAAIDRAGERARELIAAADGLLARRDELRGRLEAYQAKAAGHRLDEHGDLGRLHSEARTLLYTAPCDLPGATRAVFAYQRALTELLDAGHGRKGASR